MNRGRKFSATQYEGTKSFERRAHAHTCTDRPRLSRVFPRPSCSCATTHTCAGQKTKQLHAAREKSTTSFASAYRVNWSSGSRTLVLGLYERVRASSHRVRLVVCSAVSHYGRGSWLPPGAVHPHPWSPTLLHGCLRAVVEEEGSRRTPAKSPGGGGASRSERKRFAVQLMHAIILTMCCTMTVETFRGQFNILSHVVPLFSFTELFTSWDVRGGEESLRTFCQSHPERNQK